MPSFLLLLNGYNDTEVRMHSPNPGHPEREV